MIDPEELEIDHDAPPTHEDEQAKQPKLGKVRKNVKAKKSVKKAKAGKRGVRAKVPETTAVVGSKPRGRGKRLDGKPRRAPGTNPPVSDEAAKFGRKVAKGRQEAGMTQRQLATRIGIHQSTIANVERGVAAAGDGLKEALRKGLMRGLGLS